MGPAVEFRVKQRQFASGGKSFTSADLIDRAYGQASAAAYAALDVLMKIFLRHLLNRRQNGRMVEKFFQG